MAFDETRFPEKISYGARGGPEFKTLILTADSGAEQRLSAWANGRVRWNVSHGVNTRAKMSELQAFFYARRGKARGFRFKDWTDFKALNTEGIVIATDAGNQLFKTYTSGGVTYSRPIYKPVAVTVTFHTYSGLTKVPVEGTVDPVTGLTEVEPGTYWEGQFDVPARFDTDILPTAHESFELFAANDIPIIEILDIA